jgi:hypothetical protein
MFAFCGYFFAANGSDKACGGELPANHGGLSVFLLTVRPFFDVMAAEK